MADILFKGEPDGLGEALTKLLKRTFQFDARQCKCTSVSVIAASNKSNLLLLNSAGG
ncbi:MULTISPECIES: hypothetical protein [unclassified Acidovorax]|uniref:hypothetical protein n=1 Tax=unclassified Acidovorax TaxID=2684926 RepID=UPI002882D892|nr:MULTISPECIES: hypothetical protein [unclassified Acidovorax]